MGGVVAGGALAADTEPDGQPRLDAPLVARTAGLLLDGALVLADAAEPLLAELDLDPHALGSLAGLPLLRAHQRCLAEVSALLAGLGRVLEDDADRFYHLAFAADRAAAARRDPRGSGGGSG